MHERARPLREPAAWILLVTAVVHVIRRNPVDVAVFLGTVVLILLDSRATPRRPGRQLRVHGGTGLAVSAAYALAVLPLARTGLPMRVAIAVPGLAALVVVWLTWGRSAVRAPDAPPRSWLAWPTVLVTGALFELFNFTLQPDPETDSRAHPTVSALVDPLLAGQATRAVAAGLWVAAGFWVVALVTRSLETPSGGGPSAGEPLERPRSAGEELP